MLPSSRGYLQDTGHGKCGGMVYSYLPLGSLPCIFPTYLKFGSGSAAPGASEISSTHKSRPCELLPILQQHSNSIMDEGPCCATRMLEQLPCLYGTTLWHDRCRTCHNSSSKGGLTWLVLSAHLYLRDILAHLCVYSSSHAYCEPHSSTFTLSADSACRSPGYHMSSRLHALAKLPAHEVPSLMTEDESRL